MKIVTMMLLAVSVLTTTAAFAGEAKRIDYSILHFDQTEVIAEGRDLAFNQLGVALKGLPGSAVWINKIFVTYKGGPFGKLVNVNKLALNNSTLWIQLPALEQPVHRIRLETTPTGISDDATLTFFAK